jgi:hypothetical protein
MATTAPEERSIPAVIITIVTPRDIIPITLICRRTFNRLVIRRKTPPESTEITIIRPIRINRMLYFFSTVISF